MSPMAWAKGNPMVQTLGSLGRFGFEFPVSGDELAQMTRGAK